MEVNKEYTGYNDDGSEYKFIWTQESADKHEESYCLKWVENNDDIRYYLKKEIKNIRKYRKDYGYPNTLIEQIQKDIDSREVGYNDYVQMVVVNNNLDVEVYRTNGKPFKYWSPISN